jgi:hypothetical protein
MMAIRTFVMVGISLIGIFFPPILPRLSEQAALFASNLRKTSHFEQAERYPPKHQLTFSDRIRKPTSVDKARPMVQDVRISSNDSRNDKQLLTIKICIPLALCTGQPLGGSTWHTLPADDCSQSPSVPKLCDHSLSSQNQQEETSAVP